MADTPEQPAESATPKPGKIRTWWHPLLASLLRWQLGEHYLLQEEEPVGQKPLQIDILLLRKGEGELPPEARQILAGLAEHLGEYTLLEFKSPTDTLRAGDFQTLLVYTWLYRAQNQPLLEPERLHLLVLAPRMTKPYRAELELLGVTPEQQESGVWRLQGGVVGHAAWLLETAGLAGTEHPLMTVFSPQFVADRVRTYQLLRRVGYREMIGYMAQQFQHYEAQGEEFAMQHLDSEQMREVYRDLLLSLPMEERQKILTVEERLAGLSVEERLAGIPPEERLLGLTEDDLRRLPPEKQQALRRLLQRLSANGDPPPSE